MHLGRMAESGRGLDSSCPKWSKANAFHNHQYLSVRHEATSRDALDLVWLLETSRNLINGHSPISLLHLSFNSYLEVIISGRQHKKREHFKTQKEPNQVICSSYPALCDKGYQFLVVLSEVLVLRSYVSDGYNIIHWKAHKICSARLIFWEKHLDTSALVISHLHRVEDYGLLHEEDKYQHNP